VTRERLLSSNNNPLQNALCLAADLRNPDTGDVAFEIQSGNEEVGYLYADKRLLSSSAFLVSRSCR
jgi:hypothetical protein